MPETIINHLLKIHNLNPSNTCFVTTCGYVDAVAWSTRNSQIIRLCSKENDGKLPLLDAAERQLPVAVIARSDEPLLNNLPGKHAY